MKLIEKKPKEKLRNWIKEGPELRKNKDPTKIMDVSRLK